MNSRTERKLSNNRQFSAAITGPFTATATAQLLMTTENVSGFKASTGSE